MEEKKKRWRPSLTAYRELEKKVADLEKENKELRNGVVSISKYNELRDKVATLEKSNKYLEDGRDVLLTKNKELRKDNEVLAFENKQLKERGFWARVFNK